MNVNYQLEMEKTIAAWHSPDGRKPVLLLHSCCAPCSSAVLERLAAHFTIYDFYYNPNISPEAEYRHRAEELRRLIREMGLEPGVQMVEGAYEPERFARIAAGLEGEPEGGRRCTRCFVLRLEEAAREAARRKADFFTTTLSISPHKDARRLNEIGRQMGEKYGVPYLFSDFKKKDGFKRSTILSEQYGLYRQNYCGCIFSRREAEERERAKAGEKASAAR